MRRRSSEEETRDDGWVFVSVETKANVDPV